MKFSDVTVEWVFFKSSQVNEYLNFLKYQFYYTLLN